jgi:hypothetical protein
VYAAVGVRIDEVPITPDKILRALDAKRAGRPARVGPVSFPEIAWPTPLLIAPPWEGGDGTASNEPPRRSKRRATGTAPSASPLASPGAGAPATPQAKTGSASS